MKFWIIPVLLLLAGVSACNKRVPPPAAVVGLPHVEPQPGTPIVAPSEPAAILVSSSPVSSISEPPPPPIAPALAAFDEAERAFVAADYPRAISRYDEYLKLAPTGDRRDQALWHLGLMHALPSYPQRDLARAMTFFKELITQYPASPYQPAAQLFTVLRTEILQLSADRDRQADRARRFEADLERYKQIDSDRLKRVP